MFLISALVWFLLSRRQCLLGSRWLPPKYVCTAVPAWLRHTGHCYTSWASSIGRTVGFLPPLEACMDISCIVKDSPQRGSIQVSLKSGSSELCE